MINAVGNTSGFAAPYITGWLADLTGSQKTGLWVVGACMVAAAVITLLLREAPTAGSEHTQGQPDRA